MKKIFILAVILALVISCSFGIVASAADYSKIDISDYVSGREFVGDDVIVSYDLPLDPWTELYGFATGSNVPKLISSFQGDLIFSQGAIDESFEYLEVDYYIDSYDLVREGDTKYHYDLPTSFHVDELVDVWTHISLDGGPVVPINWDWMAQDAVLANFVYDNYGTDIEVRIDLDESRAIFELTVSQRVSIDLGVLATGNDVADFQRINGQIFPLGKTNTHTNIISVGDIKSGSGFTLSFDLRYYIEHDAPDELNGNIAYYDAVWLDKDFNEISRSQEEIDWAPYPQYQEYQFDIDFTVPQGASYFYLDFTTGYFYVNTAYEFSWVITDITMSATLSSIEENSQTMQKVQQKLDKIDDQLGDIQDSIGDTNDKLDDIVDHVPDPIPPEGSDVIEDTDDIEHDLIDDAIGNLDQLEDVKLSAMEAILLYAGGFACVSTIIDLFARLPFFTGLLYVSLSLGIVSSLLSIANTISSRSGKSHAGKE